MKIFGNIDDLPNILYHGTTSDCVDSLKKGIVIERSRVRTDFGEGFYLTANKSQAIEWALVKKGFKSGEGVTAAVVQYKLRKEALRGLNILYFEEPTDEWADFIFANRELIESMPNNIDAKCDVVYGPMGDGFKIARAMKKRKQNPEDTKGFRKDITSSRYKFPEYHQFSFHTDEAIKSLSLKGVEIVWKDNKK